MTTLSYFFSQLSQSLYQVFVGTYLIFTQFFATGRNSLLVSFDVLCNFFVAPKAREGSETSASLYILISSYFGNRCLCVQLCILTQEHTALLRDAESVHDLFNQCNRANKFPQSRIQFSPCQKHSRSFIACISFSQWLLLLLIECQCLLKVCGCLIQFTIAAVCQS